MIHYQLVNNLKQTLKEYFFTIHGVTNGLRLGRATVRLEHYYIVNAPAAIAQATYRGKTVQAWELNEVTPQTGNLPDNFLTYRLPTIMLTRFANNSLLNRTPLSSLQFGLELLPSAGVISQLLVTGRLQGCALVCVLTNDNKLLIRHAQPLTGGAAGDIMCTRIIDWLNEKKCQKLIKDYACFGRNHGYQHVATVIGSHAGGKWSIYGQSQQPHGGGVWEITDVVKIWPK